MSEPIRPALTAEEWAEIRPLPWTVENMHGWLEQPIDEPHDFLRVAALCLFGRLTWGQVDDIREAAEEIQGYADRTYLGDGDDNDTRELVHLAVRLGRFADLIESLLPPRDAAEPVTDPAGSSVSTDEG